MIHRFAFTIVLLSFLGGTEEEKKEEKNEIVPPFPHNRESPSYTRYENQISNFCPRLFIGTARSGQRILDG